MRSRYTAYALGKVAYVISTTHPDSPHARDDRQAWADELRAYCDAVRFTGLEVLSHGTDDEGGHVHFRAHLLGPGGPSVQEERSRFAKVDGRWAYLNGT
jgi:SEC-C motif-containing protein